ncbi:hypothetical protein GGD63_006374 [Bradyrhizobium sp. cir1]|uniref:hypothetical protein n=1 Tax=Bradyrhizobium sp. cir1 TaxID=1445730 RepID=UPI0016058A77|nr:hypothetical protein [Bradyrhizobium sp. cir1]MBB4373551.1 hypothetical protein [Bradyrhizobium sp. cir1]
MIEVLRSAASVLRGLKVYGHSDNVGVLVPRHIDTTVLEQSLSDAFTAHPAGPFILTTSGSRLLSQPSRFLGYDFVKPMGQNARADAPNVDGREAVFCGDILTAESMAELKMVRHKFLGYCAAFRLSNDVREMQARLVSLFDAEVHYRQRVAQEQAR